MDAMIGRALSKPALGTDRMTTARVGIARVGSDPLRIGA